MGIVVTVVIYTVLVFATSAIGALTGIGGGVIRKPVFDALGNFDATEIAFLNVLTVLAMSLVSILKQSKNFRFVGLKKETKSQRFRNTVSGQTIASDVGDFTKTDAITADECVAATGETTPKSANPLPDGREEFFPKSDADTAPVQEKRSVFQVGDLILLSVGSVIGGVGGEFLFSTLVKDTPDANVKFVQNCVLLVVVVAVLAYMVWKDKIPTAHLKNPVWYILAGLFLGIVSSFLGIGGGPMNLAVFMLMFSMSTKEAAYSSLLVILVSQASKLVISAITGTILVVTAPLIYTSVGFLVTGAVLGGFVGSALSKRFSDKAVVISFNILQIALIGVIIYNIVRTVGAL